MSLPLYFELGFLLTIYHLKTLWWLQSIVGKEIGILPIKSVYRAQHVLISGGENCFFSDDVGGADTHLQMTFKNSSSISSPHSQTFLWDLSMCCLAKQNWDALLILVFEKGHGFLESYLILTQTYSGKLKLY